MPGVRLGFFPLDEKLQLGEHCWTPETVKQMVKLGVEIPSYRRAAENFSDLTKVGVSKSRLGELVKLYGGKIVSQQEAEATAMVTPPAQEEVITVRQMPQPDSEVMALSMVAHFLVRPSRMSSFGLVPWKSHPQSNNWT